MALIAAIRPAWLRLARDRAVSVLAVLALGATLGAALCAWTFSHLVIAQPLPYPQQGRLAVAEQVLLDPDHVPRTRQFSYPAIGLLHQTQDVFGAAAMLDRARDILRSHPAQPLVAVTYATADYPVLFAPPMARGRFPGPAEATAAPAPVAVLSHAAWLSLFDRREDILGQTLQTASGTQYEVVGVTAPAFVEPAFHGPGDRTDIWLPWAFNSAPVHWGWGATTDSLVLVGRLRPGLDPRAAAERLTQLSNAHWQAGGAAAAGALPGATTRIELVAAQRAIAGNGFDVAPLLLAGTLGLLLIALVNVTHLLVARNAERHRDFLIHRALGAGRRHVFGLVFADTLLLMLATAVVAVAVAAAGLAVMKRLLGGLLPRLGELALGWGTLGLALAAAGALALLLAGIALLASGRSGPASGLNPGRPGVGAKIPGGLRTGLMASQVAAAALLLFVSLGLLREAQRVLEESSALRLQRTASAFLYPTAASGYDAAAIGRGMARVARRLAELPAVEAVSQSHSPLQDFIPTVVASIRSGAQYPVELKRIDPAYFDMVGQTLVLGRGLPAGDGDRSGDSAVVNAAFAQRLQADGGVLGAQLTRGERRYSVVGVVADTAYPQSPAGVPRIYLPASTAGQNLLVRFRPGHGMRREQLVALLGEVDAGLALFLYNDLARQRDGMLLPRRITAGATLLVALLVMLVSGLGLYGMVRYGTQLRRTEIGVRLAFGARRGDIVSMLVRNHAGALACGLAASGAVAVLLLIGLPAPFAAHLAGWRWFEAAAACGALVLLAVAACYLSARPLLVQSPAVSLRDPVSNQSAG